MFPENKPPLPITLVGLSQRVDLGGDTRKSCCARRRHSVNVWLQCWGWAGSRRKNCTSPAKEFSRPEVSRPWHNRMEPCGSTCLPSSGLENIHKNIPNEEHLGLPGGRLWLIFLKYIHSPQPPVYSKWIVANRQHRPATTMELHLKMIPLKLHQTLHWEENGQAMSPSKTLLGPPRFGFCLLCVTLQNDWCLVVFLCDAISLHWRRHRGWGLRNLFTHVCLYVCTRTSFVGPGERSPCWIG